MMVKPMKTLELHYSMIQFLIKADKPLGMLVEHEKNLFYQQIFRNSSSTNIPSRLSAFIQ